MVEKLASTEIAQSWERFRIDALTAIYGKCENDLDRMDFEDWRDLLVEFGEKSERDTRERIAQLIEEQKSMYPSEIFQHLENFREQNCFDCCAAAMALHTFGWLAERIRGKV